MVMTDSSDDKISELRKDKIEELIEQKVQEKTEEKNKEIEKLKQEVNKLKNNSNPLLEGSESQESKGISRREFLKKASIGFGGLAALASPVSADYFIKDDSFSVQTSNDGGSTLSEGLFVDQNQNVDVPNGVLSVQGSQVATENWVSSNFSNDSFSGSHNDLTNVGSSDHHSRYTDSEASSAAPVKSVNGQTGNISISSTNYKIIQDSFSYYGNSTSGTLINQSINNGFITEFYFSVQQYNDSGGLWDITATITITYNDGTTDTISKYVDYENKNDTLYNSWDLDGQNQGKLIDNIKVTYNKNGEGDHGTSAKFTIIENMSN